MENRDTMHTLKDTLNTHKDTIHTHAFTPLYFYLCEDSHRHNDTPPLSPTLTLTTNPLT